MHTESHCRSTGLLVKAGRGDTLASIGKPRLAEWLSVHGYALLRDFDCDVVAFSQFVKANSSRVSLDPARKFHAGEGKVLAQKVDAGVDALGLHCENGNSPFWPDICWFYCEQPPAHGSQTTLCDGTAVYSDLAPDLREMFLAQDIIYKRRVAEPLWKNYVRHADASAEEQDTTTDSFRRLLALMNDTQSILTLHEDASITYDFRTPAILERSAFKHGRRAFANSILGPSFNYEPPRITFSDGTLLDDALRARIAKTCERHVVEVEWEHKDIVVIDNARVMHGRRKIEDIRRSIYNSLSYF